MRGIPRCLKTMFLGMRRNDLIKRSIFLFFAGSLLSIFFVFIWVHINSSATAPLDVDLLFAGVEGENMKLGPTEAVEEVVEKTFRANSIYHLDLKGGMSLFAMHWNENQIRPSMVGMHVPDNCFRAAGLVMLQKEKVYVREALPLAEFRIFERNKGDLYVYYWHFVDQYVVDYDSYQEGRTFGFFRDNWKSFLGEYSDMFYIRLVSDRPFEERKGDENYEACLDIVETIRTLLVAPREETKL